MKLIIQNIYEKHKKRKGRQGKKYICRNRVAENEKWKKVRQKEILG